MIRTTTMNFVDVQPNFSLDYAWTSPSRLTTVMSTTKPSKTSRKQNRCCDQCRKGKRACDAAILEDTLLDDNRTGQHATTFHYSDVFGPLAPCGNCEKTKKICTFEWLKSQRIAQSNQTQDSPLPPAKRRRTSPKPSKDNRNKQENASVGDTPSTDNRSEIKTHDTLEEEPLDMGIPFADFPGGPDAFDFGPSSSMMQYLSGPLTGHETTFDEDQTIDNLLVDEHAYARGSGRRLSMEAISEDLDDERAGQTSATTSTRGTLGSPRKSKATTERRIRKRSRRGSSSSLSNGAPPYPAISSASHLISSTSNAMLTENLLRIYRNSFENAISCWLTERNCPQNTNLDVSLMYDSGPDWSHIYHRVFRLDRVMTSIRGRQLTVAENTLASKSLNLAIYAFATQWMQPSTKMNAKFPFKRTQLARRHDSSESRYSASPRLDHGFDRSAQMRIWTEANKALQETSGLESFRVALAHIIFALTNEPVVKKAFRPDTTQISLENRNTSAAEQDMYECEDLMSKLNLVIEEETQTTHMERGVRLIHSLRSRILLRRDRLKAAQNNAHRSSHSLDPTDDATVDLLFRVSVMLDTLYAVINRRPLVVSDEDSEIFPSEDFLRETPTGNDDRKYSKSHFTFEKAAEILCDAAPLKVALFRRITRIQTLLTRDVRGIRLETSITAAMEIIKQWDVLYKPFIQNCIRNHTDLHPRIQSWYICLAGHWHLGTLLLADLIAIADDNKLGLEADRTRRSSTHFVAALRNTNCHVISEIARCACPRDDPLLPRFDDFRALLHRENLLGEPWTAILVRGFSKAAAILLQADMKDIAPTNHEDVFTRTEDCVRALQYLGRRSETAMAAAKILEEALRARRHDMQTARDDVPNFLEGNEIWHEFGDLLGEFGVDENL